MDDNSVGDVFDHKVDAAAESSGRLPSINPDSMAQVTPARVSITATFDDETTVKDVSSCISHASSLPFFLSNKDDNDNLNNIVNDDLPPGLKRRSIVPVVDIIEWLCHVILVEETSMSKLSKYFDKLGRVLSMLEKETGEECIYSHGRLHSRLNLVAVIYDVLSISRQRQQGKQLQDGKKKNSKSSSEMPSKKQAIAAASQSPCTFEDVKAPANEEKDNDDAFFSVWWTNHDWERVHEQLLLAKCILHCKDANRFITPPSKVFLTQKGDEAKTEDNIALAMKQLTASLKLMEDDVAPPQNLDLIEKDYQQLLRHLKVQSEIAIFHARLHELQGLQRRQRNEKQQNSSSALLKQIERAIDEYNGGLTMIFQTEAFKDEKECKDDKASKDESEAVTGEATIGETPKELVSFILPDLYQSKNTDNLLDRLLSHLENEVSLNSQNEFSLQSVQRKFRSLLIQWSHLVLDPPAVVTVHDPLKDGKRLVACSVSSEEGSAANDDGVSSWGKADDDEVSSWGGDDGELLRSFEDDHIAGDSHRESFLVGTQIDIPAAIMSELSNKLPEPLKRPRQQEQSKDDNDEGQSLKKRCIRDFNGASQ